MATVRFFHEIYGNVHELPDRGAFPYERGLQKFFEKHLRTLTGVEFLDSEHSTGQLHSRRIDTLGIDGAGRPVVVEYKRRSNENVINQGLDYLAWLEDHRAEFRELVRAKLGDERVAGIAFGTPRLLCIAGEFLRQDRIAAENSRRRVELLRYRRYGDAYVALEWVYGGEAPAPPAVSPPGPPPVAPHPAGSGAGGAGKGPDYSRYLPWTKNPRGDPKAVPPAQRVGGIPGPRANRLAQDRAFVQVPGRTGQREGHRLRRHTHSGSPYQLDNGREAPARHSA